MKLRDIVDRLGLKVIEEGTGLNADVSGGYTSDLLSDVLANSSEGDLWITLQVHQNIIAVAEMKGHAGIVLTGGRAPEEETMTKARSERIPLLSSEMSGFELSGRLYAMLNNAG